MAITGWVIGSIVTIGFLLLTLVCYQIYHEWEGFELPKWLTFATNESDSKTVSTIFEQKSEEKKKNAEKMKESIKQPHSSISATSSEPSNAPSAVQLTSRQNLSEGLSPSSSSRVAASCKKTRKDK